jgi:hypothetical protein
MTLHDESLLTAYLDGELAPDERALVESALLSDPELAEQFRQLTAVHELVAGLPRPVPGTDLAGAIRTAIEDRSAAAASGFWQRFRLRGRDQSMSMSAVWQAIGAFGLAASLLIGVYALRPQRSPVGANRAVAASGAGGRTEPGPANFAVKGDRAASTLTPVPASTLGPALALRPRGEALKRTEVEVSHPAGESETIREMLDNPHLRRVFIVTDVIGGEARSQVEDLVQTTPRTEASFAKIIVSQGIIIDPRHPNEATVFALVMNDQEQRLFQKKLEQSFPQRVQEVGADPVLVTQLTNIGQVAVLPGTRASEVVIPGDVSPHAASAMRTDESRQRSVETSRITKDFGRPDLPSPSGIGSRSEAAGLGLREKSGSSERPLRDGEAVASANGTPLSTDQPGDHLTRATSPLLTTRPRPPNLLDPPSIVLVWVTSP